MNRRKKVSKIKERVRNSKYGSLSDFKVIEIGNNVAVSYCGKLIADLGAEVIKIENPQTGRVDRQLGNFCYGDDGLFLSHYLDCNKLSVSLDLENKLGKKIFYELVRETDVVVEGNSTARAKVLGIEYNRLRDVNNMAIITSITPFGQTGPYHEYKAYAINCGAASSGKTAGLRGREPLCPPLSQPHFQAGCMAATATLGAILARETIGHGQHVDISEVETWLTHHTGYGIASYIFYGRKRIRSGRSTQALFPNGILHCKDGDLFFLTVTGHQWSRFLEMVGDGKIPEWYSSDTRFTSTNFRELNFKYGHELWEHIEPWLLEHTKEEIFTLGRENDVAIAPIRTIPEVIEDNHLNAREFFIEINDFRYGRIRLPGPPYRLSKTPAFVRSPAPKIGQHNKNIFIDRLGYSREYIMKLRADGII